MGNLAMLGDLPTLGHERRSMVGIYLMTGGQLPISKRQAGPKYPVYKTKHYLSFWFHLVCTSNRQVGLLRFLQTMLNMPDSKMAATLITGMAVCWSLHSGFPRLIHARVLLGASLSLLS